MRQLIHRTRRLWYSLFVVLAVFAMTLTSLPLEALRGGHVAYADNSVSQTGVEEGEIRQHEMFEFEAFINHDNIADGTEPFDSNNQPGNDSHPHNKIVRTWDTVTYPLKITINPKKADMLENIKLKIWGELENGITDDRVNAKFAIGGTENLNTGKVSFVQEYTIERTGNAIMIPVTIEVLGAKHNVKLKPTIRVQVVSVDGEDISQDNVITVFDDLPEVTTSAKVSIKPIIGSGLAGNGIPYYPYAGITGNDEDKENTHAFSISWGIENLPGKSNIRGATFPDPNGKIHFRIELSGRVDWDNPARQEAFDFYGRDSHVLLLDHRPISDDKNSVGSPNTMYDGQSYRYNHAINYTAPLSELTEAQRKNETYTRRGVWDSGDWYVSQPDIQRNKIVYEGYNTGYVIGSTFPRYRADGYTGSTIYGVNERVFASRSFLVFMPNEYRIYGPNNPEGKANNAHYFANVTLLGYTDENGNEIDLVQRSDSRTFTERNNPSGSYSVQTTFKAYPSGAQLGTPNIGWSQVSKGDASTLIGEDVYFEGALGSSVVSYGGYRAVMRWNTDAFELTPAYAQRAEQNWMNRGYYTPSLRHVKNDKNTMNVLYGVPKFPREHNNFDIFTRKGIHDYDWYDTYEEAIQHGEVGAMQMDVTAPVGPKWQGGGYIPLRVKHERIGIGSKTIDDYDSYNIGVVNYYPYPTENRKNNQGEDAWVDVSRNRAYHNPAIWDENGNMLDIQSPKGSTINFETLAVVPAEVESIIKSDKSTYYNSETIKWTAENSIVLPESGVPEDLDAGVTIKHTLPKGLDYKAGTGKIGDTPMEPEIITHSNGSKTLVWQTLVSNRDHSIPNITFHTTINPFALDSNGVQSSAEVKAVIESDLDRRREHLRTHTHTVTILKVGMVGIYQTIDKVHGDKNSDFTITMTPYTTIEDEEGVTGLTVIPLSGDRLGSNYSGTASIKDIDVHVDRRHDEPVKIYLNRSPVNSTKPHEIDVRRNGWYEYTGQASQLDGAVSMLFYVQGKMTNRDDIRIKLNIQTNDNKFGDVYLNETVINSDTNYRLSPVSNRVRYTIRPDLELKLERFQIFTNKASEGLPTSVRVGQVVLGNNVEDLPITLAIYETDSGEKVAEKTYRQRDLERENAITIPARYLTRDSVKNYEVRIEGFDENRVWVRDGEGSLDTDGHTSKEGTLTLDDANDNGDIIFKDVVMTERELGRDMVKFYETWKIHHIDEPRVKAGYGFEFTPKLEYENEVMNDVRNRISGVAFETELHADVHHKLMDTTVEYYDEDAGYSGDDRVKVPMVRENLSAGANKTAATYKFPSMLLEKRTGLTYTANQQSEIDGPFIEAGEKIYVPTWIESVGDYGVDFANDTPVGSHFMNFKIPRIVDVYAYMFHHSDSNTPDDDELLIHPIKQEDIPDELGSVD